MTEDAIKSEGCLVASLLAGSWRRSSPAFKCSAGILEKIAPLLLASGAAALAWWRIRQSDLQTHPAADELHNAYRHNTLQAALQQQTIERVITLLRSKGIESILIKGWAVARLYPEQGLRPCGDIDLCVRPEQLVAAETALRKLRDLQHEVDLHGGFVKLGGGSVDKIYARARLMRLGETDVLVPSAEDHLRILCIHMLREGGWRPIWLCDIAVAVESRGAGFDWTACMTENRRQADWVRCAITLAGALLGANINDTPVCERTDHLPHWLIPVILKEWESRLPSMTQRHRMPMARYFNHPAGILEGLRHRWPNPVEATICVRGSFNNFPRFPFQLGNYLARAAKFVARLPKLSREQ